jgi:hypothetical protein
MDRDLVVGVVREQRDRVIRRAARVRGRLVTPELDAEVLARVAVTVAFRAVPVVLVIVLPSVGAITKLLPIVAPESSIFHIAAVSAALPLPAAVAPGLTRTWNVQFPAGKLTSPAPSTTQPLHVDGRVGADPAIVDQAVVVASPTPGVNSVQPVTALFGLLSAWGSAPPLYAPVSTNGAAVVPPGGLTRT